MIRIYQEAYTIMYQYAVSKYIGGVVWVEPEITSAVLALPRWPFHIKEKSVLKVSGQYPSLIPRLPISHKFAEENIEYGTCMYVYMLLPMQAQCHADSTYLVVNQSSMYRKVTFLCAW